MHKNSSKSYNKQSDEKEEESFDIKESLNYQILKESLNKLNS